MMVEGGNLPSIEVLIDTSMLLMGDLHSRHCRLGVIRLIMVMVVASVVLHAGDHAWRPRYLDV